MGQLLSSNQTTDLSDSPERQYLIGIAKGDARVFSENESGTCESRGSVNGGADGLQEYSSSAASTVKNKIIRDLVTGISKLLGVKPLKPDASTSDLVHHLKNMIPDPKRGKTITPDSDKQLKLCKGVADVINKVYDNKVIDTTLPPNAICTQISSLANSLVLGLNKEYVAAAASVTRILQNLTDLREMISRSYDKLYSEAMQSSDDGLKLSAEGIKSVHELLLQEIDKQILLLTNITNTVVKDSNKDIVKLLAENTDYNGLVSSLRYSLGTRMWGDKLSYMLSGVGGVASMAKSVDNALKTIGISKQEYKKTGSLHDLELKAHEKFENMADTKGNSEYVDKYQKALGILSQYHGYHDEISKKLGGNTFGGCSACGGVEGGSCGCEGYTGGRIKLAKRLKQQKSTRVALLNDFRSKAKIYMDRVYQSIFQTGKKLAKGNIPLTDDLYRFKMAMNDLTNVFTEGIEYSLTGYYSDSNSTRMREHFLGIIQSMLNTLVGLKSLDPGFRDIETNLQAVVKLMDFFSDKFKAHTSHIAPTHTGGVTPTTDVKDTVAQIANKGVTVLSNFTEAVKGVANTMNDNAQNTISNIKTKLNDTDLQRSKKLLEVQGRGEVDGGGEFRAIVSLRNARNTFNHYYNIAKFKKNLNTVSTELKSYNKNYTEIVGSAVGLKVNSIREETANAIKSLYTDDNNGFETALKGVSGEYTPESIEQILRLQLSAKEDLYRVAQAVDEYLQKFTDNVVASPDDIQQVSKLLSSVELISNWFSEKSGDAIASLYEIFPWQAGMFNDPLQKLTYLDGNSVSSSIVRTKLGSPSNHYYTAVSETIAGALPANPFLPISPVRSLFAHKFAKYTCEKVYVLKNIISAFAYLGKKFGDQDMTRATFLSPNDMYKCLCKYLYVSAFTWINPMSNSVDQRFGTVMSSIDGVGPAPALPPSIFKEEDDIFVNIIKSMAAKVFTVTGLYNMMNFSSSGGIRNYALSPTRLVLGGGKGVKGGMGHYSYSTPKVYDDAVELYARLPLLAEFYRNIFCYEEPCEDDDGSELLISMVPEVGSMWAGFIATIFDQPINTNGLYSDNVLKRLIHEINEVYVSYKNRGSKDVVSAVISDFIAEINSRYGVMQRSEIVAYRKEEESRRRELTYADKSTPDDDYDVLDSDNIGTGLAPSDRYAKASNAYRPLESDYTLDGEMVKALGVFRRRIDKRIENVLLRTGRDGFDKEDYYENEAGQSTIPDFTRIISSAKASLSNSKDPELQFKLVRGMMLGMDVQSQTNVEASVMFHETVVAPLNILTSITHMLKKYVEVTRDWDASALFTALQKHYTTGNNALPDINGISNNLQEQFRDREAVDKVQRATVIATNALRYNDSFKAGYMGVDVDTTATQLVTLSAGKSKWPSADENVKTASHENFEWSDHAAFVSVRWEAVFKHMMNAVYSLTADTNGLCEVNVSGNRLTVNHGSLQGLCEETLAKVRTNIDRFRGVVDSDIINKYLGSKNNQSVTGSILWVHDNLVSKLFGDTDGNSGIKRAHARVTKALQLVANVDPKDQSKHITYFDLQADITRKRTQGWCVDGVISEMTHYNPLTSDKDNIAGVSYSPAGVPNNEDVVNFMSEGKVRVVQTSNDKFSHLFKELAPDRQSRNWPHPIYKQRINMYLQELSGNPGFRGSGYDRCRLQLDDTLSNDGNIKWVDTGAGLQVKFNEVMAQFLGQFWDPTSLKIYSGLIEGPANGPMSNAVFNAQGHPDLVTPGLTYEVLGANNTLQSRVMEELTETLDLLGKTPSSNNIDTLINGAGNYIGQNSDEKAIVEASGLRDMFVLQGGNARTLNNGDPKEVLYASLAKCMRTALNETNRSGVKVNVIQSIAEVPMRMKEDMKAQLPVFASQFKLLSKRAELIRSVLRLNVGVDRHKMSDDTGLNMGVKSMRGVYGDVGESVSRTHDVGIEWNRQWLDKITSCCDSMITTIRNVMTELNDAPLFFEVNEDSISNFKSRNGKLPVMPLSHLTLALSPAQKNDAVVPQTQYQYRKDLGRTGISGGDNDFMFNYGVRLLLNDNSSKPLLDHMPGVIDIVQKYNMVTPSQYQIPEKTYGDFACDVVMLARYAGQTRMYASLFGADRSIVEPSESDASSIGMFSYQMKKGLSASIDLTTSTDTSASLGLIASHISSDDNSPPVNVSRESSIIYNLLDLNISPINIHAMRREIPLVNMYNYAYTFDSFITHIVQSSNSGTKDANGNIEITGDLSTHDVLSALCKHPYAKIDKGNFYGKLENIVSGNSTLGFYGYPRFISDQLWSKALLQDTIIGTGRSMTHRGNGTQGNNKRRSDRLNIRGVNNMLAPSYGANSGLLYNEKGKSVSVPVVNRRDVLAELGRSRFDTKFMRNMFFMSNVQRVMLHKIDTELTEVKYPVATDTAIINKNLTDARDGQSHSDLYID